MLEEILAYNKQFVENKGYESYITNTQLYTLMYQKSKFSNS
jgi:hypothetical protein